MADLFLDTPLCNAHTTGCDVLWGGCPMVTLPLERFASRVAASLCAATGLGPEMVVGSQREYEDRVRGGVGAGTAKGLGVPWWEVVPRHSTACKPLPQHMLELALTAPSAVFAPPPPQAVELGLDHGKRLALRRRLQAARLTCPLFDTARFVADLESCLLRMWEIHCEGGGPRDFDVTPAAPAAG